ncbi:MAG: hypothetical protein ACI9FB_002673 [Candidatus Azotimanducaceae bacterium]|jgi:hypothetical protein
MIIYKQIKTVCTILLIFSLYALESIAHEIPERVQIKLLIQESENDLQVFIRVPLEAMRDYDFVTSNEGYLDITASQNMIREAAKLWVLDEFKLYQSDQALESTVEKIRVSLPTNKAFRNVNDVNIHFDSTLLPDTTILFWQQALVDIRLSYKRLNVEPRYSITPQLAGLGQRTITLLKYYNQNAEEFQFDYIGDPGRLDLNPPVLSVLFKFITDGFIHILGGIDHLLFLIVLIAPLSKLRELLIVISAFTLGHSITLITATFGFIPDYLWFPTLVEFIIAISIILLAIDNLITKTTKRRWLFGLGFGLVHGFGFSFNLAQSLQYSGNHLATGVLGFNLGVEIGQFVVLIAVLPLLHLVRQYSKGERAVLILISIFVGHAALHWAQEYWNKLSIYFDFN